MIPSNGVHSRLCASSPLPTSLVWCQRVCLVNWVGKQKQAILVNRIKALHWHHNIDASELGYGLELEDLKNINDFIFHL